MISASSTFIHLAAKGAVVGKVFATVLVAASPQLYQAQVATFGCNSSDDVTKLLQARSDEKTFQTLLYERIVQGECVVFLKDSVVEGSEVTSNKALLHVQARLDPPGYIAPSDDFKPKDGTPAEGTPKEGTEGKQ